MEKPPTDLRQAIPPPAHIARSPEIRTATALPLTQQHSDPSIRQEVPPSYINPEGITEERSTLFTQAPWPQGLGGGEVGITIEPPISPGEGKGQKDEDSVSSVSDAPTVQHFNISFAFKKTFREHSGANASKRMFGTLNVLYSCTLKVTYNIFLMLCGFILALIWGILNGAVAFLQTWIVSPLLRISLVLVKGILPMILEPLSLILKAVADGCRGFSPGGLMAGAMQSIGAMGRS